MQRRFKVAAKLAAATALLIALSAAPALANHAWADYHWARTANPFTVRLGDNVDSSWDAYLGAAASDWTTSSVLDAPVVAGASSGKQCRATSGRVEVCNAAYGKNGWLGLASIWLSGSHITKGTVKLNDTYYSTAQYNTPAWRRSVTCQEVGHTFGLDHQSEDPNVNTGSCIDYYRIPNPSPNQHDYDQLVSIYSHLDATTTLAATPAANGGGLRKVRDSLYVEDLGGAKRRLVWVFWEDQVFPHAAPPAE